MQSHLLQSLFLLLTCLLQLFLFFLQILQLLDRAFKQALLHYKDLQVYGSQKNNLKRVTQPKM